MKISTKLNLALAGLLGAGVSMAVFSEWSVSTLGRELEEATHGTAVKQDLVGSIRYEVWEMFASMRGTFVFASTQDSERLGAAQPGH